MSITFQKKAIYIAIWTIIWLIVFDCCINILFPYPIDSRKKPSVFQDYFEYGRSTEGKLRHKLTVIEKKDAVHARSAWLDSNQMKNIPIEGADTGKLITIYGMSHANCLAKAMIKIGTHRIRNITQGGAPPNWSYTAFQMDHKVVHSDVAILAVMPLFVANMAATSGMTAYFEVPLIFTFPRYELTGNKLIAKMPPFYTQDEFISFFHDPLKWHGYTEWLSQNDAFYSAFLFKEGITDYSIIARALKRVYFTTFISSKTESVYSQKKGFTEECDEVKILEKIVHEFTKTAHENNILPFIYIVNNQGCRDDLYRLLKPQLDADRTPYLSTHIVCPPSDQTVYNSDGHFTIEKDHELANATLKIIDSIVK